MSVLTGPEIEKQIEHGWIHINPYDPQQINPASYDLRLGDRVCVYSPNGDPTCQYQFLDSKKENKPHYLRIPETGFVVRPGRIYLMHTEEKVRADHLVGVVDGKSSIGRLGLVVHSTAGYIDPGFSGQITLEVACLGEPVKLYTGMRIAQLRFMQLAGEPKLYSGNYVGNTAEGPVPSRSWKQFGT